MKKIIIGIVIVCIVSFVGYLLFSQSDNDNNDSWKGDGDYYWGRGNLRAEEIKRIFNENEEAFDYVVSVIKSLGKVGYTIIILRETEEIIIRRAAGDFTYAGWGFPEDEKFIEYVRQLLIEEQLGIIIVGATEDIDVGPNSQIKYSEIDIFERYEETALHGRLKENWFYAVHHKAAFQ
jgi:hypothetical protein